MSDWYPIETAPKKHGERISEARHSSQKEERFNLIFGIVILIDIIVFPRLGWGVVLVFLLELVFLISLAKSLGVDWAVNLLERISNE